MLTRVTTHNDRIPLLPEALTYFHSRSPPGISILDYLKRIHRFANVQPSCFLVSLHYIDKFCGRMPSFTLSSLSVHRFLITAITVACKFSSDVIGKSALYAKVGGISTTELHLLEREFLQRLDWSLMCTREILQDYYINLVRSHSTGRYLMIGTTSTSTSTPTQIPTSSSSSSSPPYGIIESYESGLSSEDSDNDYMVDSSRPPSPMNIIDPGPRSRDSNSTTTTTAGTSTSAAPDSSFSERQRATVEQNMAFAAHQQQSQDR